MYGEWLFIHSRIFHVPEKLEKVVYMLIKTTTYIVIAFHPLLSLPSSLSPPLSLPHPMSVSLLPHLSLSFYVCLSPPSFLPLPMSVSLLHLSSPISVSIQGVYLAASPSRRRRKKRNRTEDVRITANETESSESTVEETLPPPQESVTAELNRLNIGECVAQIRLRSYRFSTKSL